MNEAKPYPDDLPEPGPMLGRYRVTIKRLAISGWWWKVERTGTPNWPLTSAVGEGKTDTRWGARRAAKRTVWVAEESRKAREAKGEVFYL